MALSKKDLHAIATLFDQKFDEKFDQKFDEKFDQKFDQKFDEKFKPIDQRLSNLEKKVDALADTTDSLSSKVETLADTTDSLSVKFENLTETVNRNYTMLEEFYVYQKEHNTKTSETLELIEGELEMHSNQISLNTAKLRQVK